MIAADNSAFQETPEVLDIVGMDFATHIFVCFVIDGFVREPHWLEPVVASIFVSRDQTHLVRYDFANEAAERLYVRSFDHLADHVALAGYRTNDGRFASVSRSTAVILSAHVRMAILLLSANVGFVNLDFAWSMERRLRASRRGFDGT